MAEEETLHDDQETNLVLDYDGGADTVAAVPLLNVSDSTSVMHVKTYMLLTANDYDVFTLAWYHYRLLRDHKMIVPMNLKRKILWFVHVHASACLQGTHDHCRAAYHDGTQINPYD